MGGRARLIGLCGGYHREAVEQSLDHVPGRSRLAEALNGVMSSIGPVHLGGRSGGNSRPLRRYSWVHSINNACLITAGLLWGDGTSLPPWA